MGISAYHTGKQRSNLWVHGYKRGKNSSIWNMSPKKVSNTKQTKELSMSECGIIMGRKQDGNIIVRWELYIERCKN